MANSFDPEELKNQHTRGFFAVWLIFDTIEEWLAGLFELTADEQEDAAVYFDDQR